jgi:diguanylate cyclase (GGDEF)-like protein
VVAYALGLLYARDRLAEIGRANVALQEVRLNQSALQLEDSFGFSAGLAHLGAVTLERGGFAVGLSGGLRRMLDGADRSLIYGVGAFFAPYVYRNRPRYGVYRDAAQVLIVTERSSYNYLDRPWYTAAVQARGLPAFSGPYRSSHGLTFIGASEAFSWNHRMAGVVLVEARQVELARMLARSLVPGDRAWVTDLRGDVLFSAASSPASVDNVATLSLRSAPWKIHLASNFPAVAKARRDALVYGVPMTICFWTIVALILYVLLRVRRLSLRAKALQETASRDGLTGLRNRAYVIARLDEELRALPPDAYAGFTVLFVDLDRFAVVNDSLGHAVGDQLLCAIAERMLSILPESAELGRIGGDEFVAYLPPSADGGAELTAERIIREMNEPFVIDERDIYISASIGIVNGTPRYATAVEMLRDADTAMYAAKSGRRRVAWFTDQMRGQVSDRFAVEQALRELVRSRRGLGVALEPVVDVTTEEVVMVEALARWTDPHRGPVPTGQFLPLAESLGLIADLDLMVLERALPAFVERRRARPGLRLCVNLAARTLAQQHLPETICQTLRRYDVRPGEVVIELGENALPAPELDRTVRELRREGLSLALDDFGTGAAGLTAFLAFDADVVKLDRSLIVEACVGNERAVALLQSLRETGQRLGASVIAEGVETPEQLALCRRIGIELAQGYLWPGEVA